jgi:SnoaL-like domain
MPWTVELFSAPALAQVLEKRRQDSLLAVPYIDGLLAGEVDALTNSFAGEPVLHDPERGRIVGVRAFEAFVAEMSAWLKGRNVSVEDLGHVILDDRGFEEVILHLDGDRGRVDLPVAIVADRAPHGLINELRIYSSSWPLTGRHTNRPPLMQPDPNLKLPAVAADYQRALAAGDAEAIVAIFAPDGYAREPSGEPYVHRGPQALHAFYEQLFSNGGGIPLEHCALLDDGTACVLEYNVVRWGKTKLLPQAGAAVYVRGEAGTLTAARIYDDVDPPL